MEPLTYVPCASCRKLNRVSVNAPSSTRTPVCGHCGAALPVHEGVVELDDLGFASLIAKSPKPVIVDFWAQWCGPCKVFAPVFERAARSLAGDFVLARVDTGSCPGAAASHSIRSVPTLVLFKDGRERARQAGALPEAIFVNWARTALHASAA